MSSALGRVLLAALDDGKLDKLLRRTAPQKLTTATVVDRAELKAAIRKARADGYSLVAEEVEPGFRSLAVPLRRADGRVVASLNIGTHTAGSLETMRKIFLPKLQALATELQSQLV